MQAVVLTSTTYRKLRFWLADGQHSMHHMMDRVHELASTIGNAENYMAVLTGHLLSHANVCKAAAPCQDMRVHAVLITG